MTEPNPVPSREPTPEQPTLGRNAGYYLDENGNVAGVWFRVPTDHYTEFTDEAVTDPAELAALRKPRA